MRTTDFDKNEFEHRWQKQMETERQFAQDFVSGRFADSLQPNDMHGASLDDLVGRDSITVMLGELERLNVAVIAWMASRDLGDALRHVRGDCHLATANVGFFFESDFFRLASYDWSDDKDAYGNPIVRHNFECKPSGTYLDWYKWGGRDDWASAGFATAIEEADERNIPLHAWWERVVDACIDSLMVTDDAECHRIESCGWRHYDEDAIPHRMIRVDAEVAGREVNSVTLHHPLEGYVGFKEGSRGTDGLPSDVVDVTDEHTDLIASIAKAVVASGERPLSQSVSLDQEDCPDDIGYVMIGDRIFRRLVLDSPTLRRNRST